MRFGNLVALAFATCGCAQTDGFDLINKPTVEEKIPAGQTYTIRWSPASYKLNTVTIRLLGGATAGGLTSLGTIVEGVDNALGAYDWAVDSSLGSYNIYGLVISLDNDTTIFQYSNPFHITKSGDQAMTTTLVTIVTSQGAGTTMVVTMTSTVVIETSSSSIGSAGSEPLSTSQKTGIGIGVGVGIPVVATVFLIWVYRLRRKQPMAEANGISEIDGTHTSIWKRFIGGSWRAELHNTEPDEKQNVAELDSPVVVHEICDADSKEPVELDATEVKKTPHIESKPQ